MPLDVVSSARRRFPRMMMRRDLGVPVLLDSSEYAGRLRIARDRIGDEVCRTDTVALEELVQTSQRVDVLERLMSTGANVPLVVPFGVDADEQRRTAHVCHRS